MNKDVPSYELCKRLKELGLLQDNEKPFHYLGNDTIVNQESIW
jgi:hypothetical protein